MLNFDPGPYSFSVSIHDFTKNLLLCIDPGRINPNMDFFPEKSYSDNSGHWVSNYRGGYKLITGKDYDIKYIICQCSTASLEDEHYDHYSVLSVTLKDFIVMNQMD